MRLSQRTVLIHADVLATIASLRARAPLCRTTPAMIERVADPSARIGAAVELAACGQRSIDRSRRESGFLRPRRHPAHLDVECARDDLVRRCDIRTAARLRLCGTGGNSCDTTQCPYEPLRRCSHVGSPRSRWWASSARENAAPIRRRTQESRCRVTVLIWATKGSVRIGADFITRLSKTEKSSPPSMRASTIGRQRRCKRSHGVFEE